MYVRVSEAEAVEIGIDRLLDLVETHDTAVHISSPKGWVALVAYEKIEALVEAAEEMKGLLAAADDGATS
ncbi:hypothetical protein GCM10022215_15140 [Nocardioides fonticola]|uniref:Uncharacterized protein n=1 Tax=Nocardioides fonticola TaxID=450363 RepID=A0ABP7XGM8_9ACTN